MSPTNLIKQHVESLLVFDAALNDALKEEVKRLKIAAGQVPNMNGNTFNGGLSQQQQQQQQQQMASYFSQPQQMQYFGGHQAQHHRPNHQPQSQNSSNGGRSLNDSMDFM
jgi:transcription factor VIP1